MNIKNIVVLSILLMLFFGCSTGKSTRHKFSTKSFEPISCSTKMLRQVKADTFAAIYKQWSSNPDFDKVLLQFLEEDNCMSNYYEFCWFVNGKFNYTEIDDFDLAEKIALDGVTKCNNSPSIELPYKCILLWSLTYLYYSHDQPEKAVEALKFIYTDSYKSKEDSITCISCFPALTEEESKLFSQFVNSSIK